MSTPSLHTFDGKQVCIHMDLVRHLSALHSPPEDPDRYRHVVEQTVRKLGAKVQTRVLEGADVQAFKRANGIHSRLGSSVKLYQGEVSIAAICSALAPSSSEEKSQEMSSRADGVNDHQRDQQHAGLQLVTLDVNGRQLAVRKDSSGRGFVVVRELEEVLGYAPKSLVTRITQEWAPEFREGDRYGYMSRSELETAERLAQSHVSRDFGQRNMVLYEHGVYQVAVKTEKELGARVRDWLTRDVLTKLSRTGHYDLPIQPAHSTLPVLAPPLQVIQSQMQHWDAWAMNARSWKDGKGVGHIDMHLWQELSHDAPVRVVKADGKTAKLGLEGRHRFNQNDIARLARDRGLGSHIDHLFIGRVQVDLGVHAGNWMALETRGARTEEVTDQEGCDFVLDFLQRTTLQQASREVTAGETASEFSLDQAQELAEKW